MSWGPREGGIEKARIDIPRDVGERSLSQGLEVREGHYLEKEESSAFGGR